MDGARHWPQTMAALGLYAAAADKFTTSVRAYSCVTRVHLHHTCVTRVHVCNIRMAPRTQARGAAVPSASAIFCKNAKCESQEPKIAQQKAFEKG